ncbi:MAG: carboxypeptidase-like regulatory domain-containing protein [Saprospiraceae bacterium]
MSSFFRIFAFFYVFFVLPNLLFPQDTTVTITGKVIDASTSKPIVFATVTLHENEQDTAAIVAFTETDEQGYFSIEIEEMNDSLKLRVGLIGYETIKIAVHSIKSDTLFISLNQESILIKEVVIIESGKIIQTTDTITYIADRFRDSTENNLEDLLVKLPGVEVSKDGKISVNGKEIKKILIDGDDMSGKNYQIMSKNLTADIIDKIQVIDRFSDNPLLKGLTNNTDQVINITVKQEKQNQLIPGGQVGIGNGQRHNHQFRLFGLFSQTKLLTTAQLNTIGEANYYDTGEKDASIFQRDALLDDKSSPVIPANSSMKNAPPYYRFNNAAIASVRFTIHPWKKVKITAWSNFDKETARLFSNTQETYRLFDSTLYITSNNVLRDKHTWWNAHLNLQINLSSRSSLQVISNFLKKNTFVNTLNNIYQADVANITLSNGLTNYITTTQNRFNYTLRINEKRAFVWSLVFTAHQKKQNFEWSSNQPLSLPFFEDTSYYILQQYAKIPLNTLATDAQMIWSEAFGGSLSLNLGGILRKELLVSGFDNQDSIQTEPNDWSNNLNYNQNNIYIGFNWKKQIGICPVKNYKPRR